MNEIDLYRITYATQDGIIGIIESLFNEQEVCEFLQSERALYPKMRIFAEKIAQQNKKARSC